jgi:hypothetical protein
MKVVCSSETLIPTYKAVIWKLFNPANILNENTFILSSLISYY